MSGIFGLWNLDGRPVEPELLAKMSGTMAHRAPDGEGQWIDGPVGLGCQLMRVTPESLTETQPLVSPSAPWRSLTAAWTTGKNSWAFSREPGMPPDSPTRPWSWRPMTVWRAVPRMPEWRFCPGVL